MTTYDQHPDVIEWGLQFFDGDMLYNMGYGDNTSEVDILGYHRLGFGMDNYDRECSNIENDELIAHALQEELSQLAVKEELVSQYEREENSEISLFSQDWLGQSLNNYGSAQDYDQEDEDDTVLSSSCSSPNENLYIGNNLACSSELSDEYGLDGEVGKWLNQMVPIPHVPRINGEIPSVDEETLDHQRLLDRCCSLFVRRKTLKKYGAEKCLFLSRLQLYELVELKVQGDGNCQFRALSDQIYRSPEHHKFVREQVVKQLQSYPEIYEGYVPMTYVDYLEKMAKSGEWGDHVTLQAAADWYGVKIFVITSFKDTCYIEIVPNIEMSKRVICLSFWAEVHYNSIYPEGDVPTMETNGKKRWWMVQNEQAH